eukprot:3420233-Pleurochrysis_carterae.AAC.2
MGAHAGIHAQARARAHARGHAMMHSILLRKYGGKETGTEKSTANKCSYVRVPCVRLHGRDTASAGKTR